MTTPVWAPGTLYQPGALVTPNTSPPPIATPPGNPGFESGDTGWTKGSGWTITNAGQKFTGSWSAQMTAIGPGSTRITNDTNVPVSPGQIIKAQCYVNQGPSAAGNTSGRVQVDWLDASLAIIQTDDGNLVDNGSNNQWHPSNVTATAPSGAVWARIAGWGFAVSAGRQIWLDTFTWDYVTPVAATGLVYRAVQAAAGYSGSAEPAWPVTVGLTVLDNEVTWEAVLASRVVWQATPILVSGATEPDFPDAESATVADNTIAWETVSRRISDTKCPSTKIVAIGASKIFSGDDDIISFSATINPRDWSTADDAGYLPFGLQTYGANPVLALGLYRGNLVAFNSAAFQMWQIDQDPANMALLDAVPIGCTKPRSVQAVQNDLVFLSAVGIRSIGIAGASTNLQAGNFGEAIDPLVRAKVIADEYEPLGLFVPAFGQYWLFFGDEAFVMTVNGTKDQSWSRYTFPEAITDWTLAEDDLVLRTASGKVWIVDPDSLVDDAAFEFDFPAITGTPGGAGFRLPDTGGNLIVSTNDVILNRAQTGIGTPRTPDGYSASGGSVAMDPPGQAIVALGYFTSTPNNFSVRVTGLDENGAAQTEDFVLNGLRYFIGTKNFSRIDSATLLSSDIGSDGSYSVGTQQFHPYPPGFEEILIDFRNLLGTQVSGGFGSVPLTGMLGPNYPVAALPPDGVITLRHTANPGESAFIINGVETILMSATGFGEVIQGAQDHDTITSITSPSDTAHQMVDIGMQYLVERGGGGGGGGTANFPIVGVIQWPHLDFGALGVQKQMVGLDLVADAPLGVNVSIGYDQRDLASRTTDYLVDGDTLPGYMIPFPLAAPSFDLKLTFEAGQAWTWYASNIYIQDFPGGV